MIIDTKVSVYYKNIKNLHIKVKPSGAVCVSAPYGFSLDKIYSLLLQKMSWINKHQQNFKNKPRDFDRYYVSGEYYYFRGQRYQLEVVPCKSKSIVFVQDKDILCMHASTKLTQLGRAKLLEAWYRANLMEQLSQIVPRWASKIQVPIPEYRVKQMKTRWGTCNVAAKRIWINLELIKKPDSCLEYVVVHELVHFLERTHNNRFKFLMTKFLPDWQVKHNILSNYFVF